MEYDRFYFLLGLTIEEQRNVEFVTLFEDVEGVKPSPLTVKKYNIYRRGIIQPE